MYRTIADIFAEEPNHYGYRGDRYFWEYLRSYFADHGSGYTVDSFVKEIYTVFSSVAGVALTVEAEPYVEQFSHGGMSSGYLSGEYWINTGIPLLVRRFEKIGKEKGFMKNIGIRRDTGN